ncbi:MAG TPA: folylpolyglutamate synthase/dihydrofolate synthase family protein [Candidatus Dormibacteraeota bacterium]|nr:folylpolyglutamate synthase/dihydrofolate synthase family protein [Candidatus Dormibacteraeota bacterium]
MNFAQAERYVLAGISEAKSPRTNYGLGRMRALLAALGDPHLSYPVVHVAGTSGKGSTATMIASALAEHALRVALHVKPHLRSMTERARVDGAAISPERFAELLTEMLPKIEEIAKRYGHPSYYEMLLALTFLYFARESVDVAVVEVGLGGRLDGTNVVAPCVCAITSIGFDHQDILGESLDLIAAEKAGIAKRGVPLVSTVEEEPARSVIAQSAARVGAPLIESTTRSQISNVVNDPYAQRFVVETECARYRISLPLLGAFQRTNAVTAILSLEALPDELRPSVEEIERGFAGVQIPGRMELFPGSPPLLFDIAHNEQKARSLAVSIGERFSGRRRIYVMSVGESKDARAILAALAHPDAYFIFTRFSAAGREANDPHVLAALAREAGLDFEIEGDPLRALARARDEAREQGIVVVTGSTFIVAALREAVLQTRDGAYRYH